MRASGVGGRGSSFRCLHRAVRRAPRARGGCPNRHAPRDKGLLFPPARLPSAMRPRGPRPPKSAPRVSRCVQKNKEPESTFPRAAIESTTPVVRPFAHTPRDLPGPTWSDLVASDWRKSPFTGGIFLDFCFCRTKKCTRVVVDPPAGIGGTSRGRAHVQVAGRGFARAPRWGGSRTAQFARRWVGRDSPRDL